MKKIYDVEMVTPRGSRDLLAVGVAKGEAVKCAEAAAKNYPNSQISVRQWTVRNIPKFGWKSWSDKASLVASSQKEEKNDE